MNIACNIPRSFTLHTYRLYKRIVTLCCSGFAVCDQRHSAGSRRHIDHTKEKQSERYAFGNKFEDDMSYYYERGTATYARLLVWPPQLSRE